MRTDRDTERQTDRQTKFTDIMYMWGSLSLTPIITFYIKIITTLLKQGKQVDTLISKNQTIQVLYHA